MICACGIPPECGPEPVPAFDAAAFRSSFPEFTDPVLWPDPVIIRSREMALCYISPETNRGAGQSPACSASRGATAPKAGKRLSGESRELAIDLMTAHLLFLEDLILKGKGQAAGGMVTSASVDKVSVTLTPPPVKGQFAYWLSLSPRGGQLLALLKSKTAGGLYVGGLPPEREAFRKAGGVFKSGKGSS